MIPRHPPSTESLIPHNLGLYRLAGFCGRRTELRLLHQWLTQEGDRPAIGLSGEQGIGKSTLATAAAWANIRHFPDGVLWVGPAGTDRFRLYDIVRTLDAVLGTQIARMSPHRWGIAILEQLYHRRRLLLLDELSATTPQELETLLEIMGRLHESGGRSRIVLIAREADPLIQALVQERLLQVDGLTAPDSADLIRARCPTDCRGIDRHAPELHNVTQGNPLSLRLLMGLAADFTWPEVQARLNRRFGAKGPLAVTEVAALAVHEYLVGHPQESPFLERLVHGAGGAGYEALNELFWPAAPADAPTRDRALAELFTRALVEDDSLRQRAVLHPVIRRHLLQDGEPMAQPWRRGHAQYYARHALRYQQQGLEQWPEIDVEWGNIHQGADWCMERIQALWQRDPLELAREPWEEQADVPIPRGAEGMEDDLKLARTYGLALAQFAFWRHPPGSFRWLAAGAVACYALEDLPSYGWLLMNIGRQLFFQGQVEAAYRWLNRALNIFRQRDLLVEQAYAHTDLGTAYRAGDQPDRALTHFWSAFECLAQTGNQLELTTAYLNLGSAYYTLGMYTEALTYHRKGLDIANRLDDGHRKASAYNNMGLVLEEMGELSQAAEVYSQALAVFRSIGDDLGISTCYNNLGSVDYARRNFRQAMEWYRLDRLLSERRGAWVDLAATLHNLGHVALELNEPTVALDYFRRSRTLYDAFQLQEFVAEEETMIAYVGQL